MSGRQSSLATLLLIVVLALLIMLAVLVLGNPPTDPPANALPFNVTG